MVGAITTIAGFTPDELRDCAVEAGLGFQFVVKEAVLFELMELIDEKGLVLKGGTAINKGYLLGHQRFSEDLDYDTTLKTKEEVRKLLHGLAGWDVKKEFFTQHAIGFLLGYSFEGLTDGVKVDVALKGRTWDGSEAVVVEKTKAVSDFIPASKRVMMYRFEELNSQKESAFKERHEWKDIYDLYWMKTLYPARFRINDKIAFAKALDSLTVPKTANSYIPSTKRPNWAELKEEMKDYAKSGI
jgi:predicted nucleotidyltransferase component of viral defense system